MGITWEEAEVVTQKRSEWRQSVAQCIHLDAGWIKVKVKSGLNPVLGFENVASLTQHLGFQNLGFNYPYMRDSL